MASLHGSRTPNRLVKESSPYLLQHAYNPVDWYPWGEEAFDRAKAEDKPVLLSAGYSACHWCHVMERECFEDEQIASQMNNGFICIKVDREERPDVDAIYMNAVQLMTGQGGWPMTVMLTPDGSPFYGGTYFPPRDLYGRPGFPRVLDAVITAWKTNRSEIVEQGKEIQSALEKDSSSPQGIGKEIVNNDILERTFHLLSEKYDKRYGGFGSAPKFPQPAALDLLLRFHVRSGLAEPLQMASHTLKMMAVGGIYDQLGGGFHRYSTDEKWLVPHFEKMLYDNAQLSLTYLHAWQLTGDPLFKRILEETLEYAVRDMQGPEGGFYSSQDADSEGVEGKFYVWDPDTVQTLLGEDAANHFCNVYDVTDRGNWEGKSILHIKQQPLSVEEESELKTSRTILLQERMQRESPSLDDKSLAAWNGLMLTAIAEAAPVLESAELLISAQKCASFLVNGMTCRDETGMLRIHRTYRNGKAKGNGYLEDYAFCAEGLLRMYEADFNPAWLKAASELADTILSRFSVESGGFYAVSDDHEKLLHRSKDWEDNAIPSGSSVAIGVLLRLTVFSGESRYKGAAEQALLQLVPMVERYPEGFARASAALDLFFNPPKEISVIGGMANANTVELLRAARSFYIPDRILVQAEDGVSIQGRIPILEGKTLLRGRACAYVCQNFLCLAPVSDPAELRKLLS